MTRLPFWALLPILMVLAACSGQTPALVTTPTSVVAMAEPSYITPLPTITNPTPSPQPMAESIEAAATPTPASPTEAATSIPTQEPTTATPAPATGSATSLAIAVAPIPADISEYSRSQWKHWIDGDGDCQDARQEALVSESLVEVTFESERKCRVATGRWFGAFAGTYVEAPGDLDIDHLVPLKNAHDSGGWVWSSAKKQEYANYFGDPDHLIAVTKGANRSKGAKGPEEWRPPKDGYWCEYATDWTEVKMEWGLTMTQRETEAVIEMLDTCEEPVEVKAERAEGTAGTDTSGRAAAGEPTATPTLVPEPEGNPSVYGSCEEAVEAGELRVAGEHGWRERGSRRKWSPAPGTAMAMVLCVNVEQTCRHARPEPLIRLRCYSARPVTADYGLASSPRP